MRRQGPGVEYASYAAIKKARTFDEWLKVVGLRWWDDAYSNTIAAGSMNSDTAYEKVITTKNAGGDTVVSRINIVVIRPAAMNEASLWENFELAKNLIKGDAYVVTHGLPEIDTDRLRKLIEATFMETLDNIKIYVETAVRNPATKERSTYAIVVEAKNHGYK